MRAAYMYAPGDVRVIDAPDPRIEEPTDALLRLVRTCVCGSDLHPYHSMNRTRTAPRWATNTSASSKRWAPTSRP